MMPHLGVLSTVYKDAAWSIFDKDCLVRLGTCVAPAGTTIIGAPVMKVKMTMPEGESLVEELSLGECKLIPLAEAQEAKAIITPARQFDMGEGPGKAVERTVTGGVAGVFLDARGRPLHLPENDAQRKELLLKWFTDLDLYPEEKLKELIRNG